MDFFKGSEGGRALPMLHPDGNLNLAPGLESFLRNSLDLEAGQEVVAYIAAVVAHPAFTQHFADELTTPGIRVPITTDPGLWKEAETLGEEVVWLHTYGEAFVDAEAGRPRGDVRFPTGDPRQPLALKPVTEMPDTLGYDPEAKVVRIGDGEWGPVAREVYDYEVGGRNVVKSWFNYRKKKPGGRKSSPLDEIHVESWPKEWTIEFIDLLTVLTRLVDLEPRQAELLDRILAGPIATKDELSDRGVKWPVEKKDRAPHRALGSKGDGGQVSLDEELS